jgi:hypothetical protein
MARNFKKDYRILGHNGILGSVIKHPHFFSLFGPEKPKNKFWQSQSQSQY